MKKIWIITFLLVIFISTAYTIELNLISSGYTVIYSEVGQSAKHNVFKLHNKTIPIKDALYQEYLKDNKKILIWISESFGKNEAENYQKIMDEKMKNSNVFSNKKQIQIGGINISKVNGMGMLNYYYNFNSYNIWISLHDETIVEYLVNEINSQLWE